MPNSVPDPNVVQARTQAFIASDMKVCPCPKCAEAVAAFALIAPEETTMLGLSQEYAKEWAQLQTFDRDAGAAALKDATAALDKANDILQQTMKSYQAGTKLLSEGSLSGSQAQQVKDTVNYYKQQGIPAQQWAVQGCAAAVAEVYDNLTPDQKNDRQVILGTMNATLTELQRHSSSIVSIQARVKDLCALCNQQASAAAKQAAKAKLASQVSQATQAVTASDAALSAALAASVADNSPVAQAAKNQNVAKAQATLRAAKTNLVALQAAQSKSTSSIYVNKGSGGLDSAGGPEGASGATGQTGTADETDTTGSSGTSGAATLPDCPPDCKCKTENGNPATVSP